MASPPPGQRPDLSLQLGPLFLLQSGGCLLFGFMAVQTYIYFLAFRKDNRYAKGLVCLVFILELVQVILTTRDGWQIFASGWGDYQNADDVRLTWFSIPIMSGIIGCVVQLFYGWRVYALSNNFYVATAIALSALLQMGFSIGVGVETLRVKHLSLVTGSEAFLYKMLWFSFTAFCDLVIAITMSYYLYRAKQKTIARRTTAMLTRLIMFTIETGFITAAFSLVEVILYVAADKTLFYALFTGITSKLYSNCFLALLNSRIAITNGQVTESEGVNFMSTIGTASRTGPNISFVHAPLDSQARKGISIQVSQVSDAHRDPTGTSIELAKVES
ncbi:hypothetical protein EIP91_008256, partial [Steccherinum ochraceum]